MRILSFKILSYFLICFLFIKCKDGKPKQKHILPRYYQLDSQSRVSPKIPLLFPVNLIFDRTDDTWIVDSDGYKFKNDIFLHKVDSIGVSQPSFIYGLLNNSVEYSSLYHKRDYVFF